MSAISNPPPKTAAASLPAVPLTIEGASVLHQMMRVRWTAWKSLTKEQRSEIVEEASGVIAEMEKNSSGSSAANSLLGHKDAWILVHFRRSFDDLSQAALRLARLQVSA